MLQDLNVLTSYVQVNIYGTNLNQLRQRGVNIKQLLSCLGYSKCIILDVPILTNEWASIHNPDVITHLSESAEIIAPFCKLKEFSQSSVLQNCVEEDLDEQLVVKHEFVSKSTLTGFVSYGNIAISRCDATPKPIKTQDSLNLDLQNTNHFDAHGCPRASTPCQENDPDADRLINCTLSTICDPSSPTSEEFLDINNVLDENLAVVPTTRVQVSDNTNNENETALQLDMTLNVSKAELPRCESKSHVEMMKIAEMGVPSNNKLSEKKNAHQNMLNEKFVEISMCVDRDDDGSFYDCTSFLVQNENGNNNANIIPRITTVKVCSNPAYSLSPFIPKPRRVSTEPLLHFEKINNLSCPMLGANITINPPEPLKSASLIAGKSGVSNHSKLSSEELDHSIFLKSKRKKPGSCVDPISLKSLKSKRKKLNCREGCSFMSCSSDVENIDAEISRPKTRRNRVNRIVNQQVSFSSNQDDDRKTGSQSNMTSSYGGSSDDERTIKRRVRKKAKIPLKKDVLSGSNASPSPLNTLKIFKCQMEGCPTKIQWRPRYGKNRLVDHVRLHWKKKMKKCKICDFAAPVFRMVSYHHSKVHRGEQFEGVHSMETPDDLRELLELWKECFPDTPLVEPPEHWVRHIRSHHIRHSNLQ